MDENKVHPLYKIVAVLAVASVAKALFAPQRPAVINQTIMSEAVDAAKDALSKGRHTG